MAYSNNILPKSAAYYELNRAVINGTELLLEEGGYAEINISRAMLPKLTEKMLVVVHPSVFSSYYTSDAVKVELSIVTSSGEHIEYLASASAQASGVFSTEVELADEEYLTFTYRISSAVPVTVYNWELCAEEAIDVSTVIDGVEQSLPKLLYDYNTYPYAVAQNEMTVGLISCYLISDTDLQGHFTISFFATERCNVHVRIKDNNVTELFSPQVYTVEKGYASVSIPHAYLKKKAVGHNFSITLQCSNGQLSIPVRGMLYTIDGGYLATRLLDAGMDVQDITIKQLTTDASPSEIYAIGFEGNRLILKSREYSHTRLVDWTALKDFGEGLKAAVEFHARWTHRSTSNRHTMETANNPYVFILGVDNVLRAYQDADVSKITELDNNVTDISACQGFTSMYDILQDQGLIIAYVKDGNVYYRQWLYSIDIESYMWYPAEVLYEQGDASFVSIHRLPDYRVGICVTHASGTKWYITDRTYVSQAVKPEVFNISAKDDLFVTTVIDVDKLDSTSSTATLSMLDNDEGANNFTMTFDGTLIFLKNKSIEDLKSYVKVYLNDVSIESAPLNNSIKALLINGNVMTVILEKPITKRQSTIRITFDGFRYIFQRIYNNCIMYIDKSYSWYLPAGLIEGTVTDEATINVSATSLNVNVIPLRTVPFEYNEDVTVSITPLLDAKVKVLSTVPLSYSDEVTIDVTNSLSLVVSQIGTSPI